METEQNYLKLSGINKSFGPNQVLFNISLTLKPGTIHALVGENGAGKSTLMKVMAGIHSCDSGQVIINDQEIDISSPQKAQSHGIMLMHQEISLFPEMTVAENIYAGHFPMRGKNLHLIDYKKLYEQSEAILRQLDCDFTARDYVKNISIANQHLCEFARFLSMKPKYIILDEPTASLTENEKEILFKAIAKLKNELSLGILYISHRMHEIFSIADEVTVLRDGNHQGNFPIKEITEYSLTRLMVGREFGVVNPKEFDRDHSKEVVLEVENLCYGDIFRSVSFQLKAGEVLTLAGLIGARRTEIAEALFGILRPTSGPIKLYGEQVPYYSVQDAIHKYKMAMVSDDRKGKSLVLSMNCIENVTLPSLGSISNKLSFLKRSKEGAIYEKYHRSLMIKASSGRQRSGDLSGGNQQKVILSKWMYTAPNILILNEPTRGIDVAAKSDIYNLIGEMIHAGQAILLISSDINEVLMLSSRVITVYDGQVTGEFQRQEVDEDTIIKAISAKVEADA